MLARAAEQDWEIFLVIKDAPRVGLSGVCFHAQQCIEKYLKALLVNHGLVFERTHNLAALAKLLGERAGPLPMSAEEFASFNPCAVTFRYGDREIEVMDRGRIMALLSTFRTWARTGLTLNDAKG